MNAPRPSSPWGTPAPPGARKSSPRPGPPPPSPPRFPIGALHAGAPLIAITADRPSELRDVGAPQTIDQQGLFGRSVKWAHDTAVPGTRRSPVSSTSPHSPPGYRRGHHPTGRSGPPQPAVPGTDRVAGAGAPGIGGRSRVAMGRLGGPPLPRSIAKQGAGRRASRLGRGWRTPRTIPRWPTVAVPPSPLHADGRSSPTRSAACTHRNSRPLPIVLTASDALGFAGFIDTAGSGRWWSGSGRSPLRSRRRSGWSVHRDATQVLIDPAGWRDPSASAGVVVRVRSRTQMPPPWRRP